MWCYSLIQGCSRRTSSKEVQPSPPDQELQFDIGFAYTDSMCSPSIIIIFVLCHWSMIVPAGSCDSTILFLLITTHKQCNKITQNTSCDVTRAWER